MKKPGLFVILALVVIALSLYDININGNVIRDIVGEATGRAPISEKEVPQETTEFPLVYFCPRDNCSSHLIENIRAAQHRIHCAFYDLDIQDISEALQERSKKIDVRVVLDNRNYEKQLPEFLIRLDDDNQYSHNKFCVIDDKKVITGSFNPTYNGALRNNNNMIVIESEYLADNFEDEFRELWGGRFGTGDEVRYPRIILNSYEYENYFCPEDNCAQEIIQELTDAKESIYFMTFSFTHEGIADTIITSHARDIKGIFEKRQKSVYSQFERLHGFGKEVRYDNNSYSMHHKVFIIDNSTVIAGSMNPSKSGDERNDENILIIHDPYIASLYVEEFKYLWENVTEK